MTKKELLIFIQDAIEKRYNYSITDENQTFDEVGLDSLDIIELVMEIESEFNVMIPDGRIENCKTFGDLAETVLSLKKPQ